MTPDVPSTPDSSAPGSPDSQLISRFGPVLRAGLAGALTTDGAGPRLHAEALHQLCLTDGLLELLDWTRQGVAADPLACLWLGSLRWHRLLAGAVPDGAPDPPARETDRALADLLRGDRPGLGLLPGSGDVSVRGLSTGQMAYPSSPAQPQAADPAGLLRLTPLALVPYVEESMVLRWTEEALALTQGDPGLHADALRLIGLIRRLAVGPAPQGSGQETVQEALAQAQEIMADADEVATAAVLAQVRAAGGQEPGSTDLPEQVDAMLRRTLLSPWQEVTAPV